MLFCTKIITNYFQKLKNFYKMNKEEFLKKLEILLKFSNKPPIDIFEEDIKKYIVSNMEKSASISIILFLSAVKYAYLSILKVDPTINIKRPKRERKIP